jgi:hypothetical protein
MRSQQRTEDDVQGHVLHHPFVSAELARQHCDGLRADADQHRLATQVRHEESQDTPVRRQGVGALLAALGRRTRRASV